MDDNLITVWQLSKHLHHDIRVIVVLLKDLLAANATYVVDGIEKPLVHTMRYGSREFYRVDNNGVAIQAIEQAYMKCKDYTDSNRSLFYSSMELESLLKKSRKTIMKLLKKLYREKRTYEHDGKEEPVVVRVKGTNHVGYMVKKNDAVLALLKNIFSARLSIPFRVPRDQFLLPRDICKKFGLELAEVYSFLKDAHAQGITYVHEGEEKKLVQQYVLRIRNAWVLDNNEEALSEFRHFTRPYIKEETLIRELKCRPTHVQVLLQKLYQENTKYEYQGRMYDLVHTYRSLRGRLMYGLDSRSVALPIFREKLIEYKQQIEDRVPVTRVNLHNLLTNTMLTREDVAFLGRGFGTRLGEVRRKARQWIQSGVPKYRLFSQIQPEQEEAVFDEALLEKLGPSALKEWRGKVLGLMTILMVIEMSKMDGTDYKKILADKTVEGRREIRKKWRCQRALGMIPFGPLKSGATKE